MPIAVVLGFVAKLRGKGLWIGIITGATAQSILLSIVTCCTNWEKQVLVFYSLLYQYKYM